MLCITFYVLAFPLCILQELLQFGKGTRRKAGEAGTAFPAPDSCFSFLVTNFTKKPKPNQTEKPHFPIKIDSALKYGSKNILEALCWLLILFVNVD